MFTGNPRIDDMIFNNRSSERSNERLSERTPLLPKKEPEKVFSNEELLGDNEQFKVFVHNIEQAIEDGLHPIPDSDNKGVYSVHTRTTQNIGVFRPKHEELATFLSGSEILTDVFTFGYVRPQIDDRKLCVMPKQRYLSEVGASIIDRILGLNIVPETRVVTLSSPTFDYTVTDRVINATKQVIYRCFPTFRNHSNQTEFPAKIGSLKCFTYGFSDIEHFEKASTFFKRNNPNDMSPLLKLSLQIEYEKYVVLNYIIRNPDSSENDWLIRYDELQAEALCRSDFDLPTTAQTETSNVSAVTHKPQPPLSTIYEAEERSSSGQSVGNTESIELKPVEQKERDMIDLEEPLSSTSTLVPENETFDDFDSQPQINVIETGKTDPEIKQSLSEKHSEQKLVSQQPSTSSGNQNVKLPQKSQLFTYFPNQKVPNKPFRIAAINVCSGFPYNRSEKHDTEITYAWTRSVLAKQQFSIQIKRLILPKLYNANSVYKLFDEIKLEFKRDVDSDRFTLENQLSVMRGQIYNLTLALCNNSTPLKLSKKRFNSLDQKEFEARMQNDFWKYELNL